MAKPRFDQDLFNSALAEINNGEDYHPLELSISQLQVISEQQHQQAAILFDLALEELLDPNAAHKYLTLEQATRAKTAESPSLSKALERFESVVKKPFQPTPQSAKAARSTSYRRPLARSAAIRAVPISLAYRLRAAFLDTPFVSVICLGIAIPFLLLSDQGISRSLENLLTGDALELLQFTALFLKLIIPAAIAHRLLALSKKGITFGMRYCGLKVICNDGSLPSAGQLTVRAFLTPLTLLTLPLAIVSKANVFLSDVLTSTTVARR